MRYSPLSWDVVHWLQTLWNSLIWSAGFPYSHGRYATRVIFTHLSSSVPLAVPSGYILGSKNSCLEGNDFRSLLCVLLKCYTQPRWKFIFPVAVEKNVYLPALLWHLVPTSKRFAHFSLLDIAYFWFVFFWLLVSFCLFISLTLLGDTAS